MSRAPYGFGPSALGYALRSKLEDVGAATRLFLRLLAMLPAVLRRPRLLVDQVHFLGNYSLVIITDSQVALDASKRSL